MTNPKLHVPELQVDMLPPFGWVRLEHLPRIAQVAATNEEISMGVREATVIPMTYALTAVA